MKNKFIDFINTMKRTNSSITISMIALVIFGSIMVVSAQMSLAEGDSAYLAKTIVKQLLYFISSLIIYFASIYFFKPKQGKRITYLIIAAILMFSLFIPRIMGININGAYAWIPLGLITIQPSEFVKPFIIFFLANSINEKKADLAVRRKEFIWDSTICLIFPIVIFVFQGDTGSAIVIAAITLIMLSICSKRIYGGVAWFAFWATFAAFLIILLTMTTPIVGNVLAMIFGEDDYRIQRFLASVNPFIYQYNQGYHLVLSLVTFASGGLSGMGYGNSIHKYMNFPNVENDFILPIIVEELGIGGFIAIIVGYSIIIFTIIKYMFKGKTSLRVQMIGLGLITYLLVHFVLNVGGVSGLLPLTGVPLLLISAGGSSLWGIACALGIMQAEISEMSKIQ